MSWRSRPMSKEEIKAAADRAEGRGDEASQAETEPKDDEPKDSKPKDSKPKDPKPKRGGDKKPQPPPRTASSDDFHAFLPQRKYWYAPTRELWPAETINSILGKGAATALDINKPTHQVTWAPGLPMIIKDRLVYKTGWRTKQGANTFNLYLPPEPIGGDADKAGPWRQHGESVWGEHQQHIERWLAHRIQFPQVKINHGLVMGSPKQGIGKDSYLAPARRAVGEWNFGDVAATRAYEKFANENSFLENVILRINEAHDLGDKRFNFYERTKDWFAAPPETLMIRDLWIKQHPMFNLVGPIVTTNHLTDGLYLPPEDRRYYVAWSDRRPQDFTEQYWNDLWNWFEGGGLEHAARYLATLNVDDFDPKAPPPKTAAWDAIVNANMAPEGGELADLLDAMGDDDRWLGGELKRPDAVTPTTLKRAAASTNLELYKWFDDRKNRRALPHKLERVSYSVVRNLEAEDGLWLVTGKRESVYVRAEIKGVEERLSAVRRLQQAEQERVDSGARRTEQVGADQSDQWDQ
jgi:hypothetical protein